MFPTQYMLKEKKCTKKVRRDERLISQFRKVILMLIFSGVVAYLSPEWKSVCFCWSVGFLVVSGRPESKHPSM
jgi:hypothetical protein